MEYYSAIKKNTFVSVLMRWMKVEPIIQTEVSQKKKKHALQAPLSTKYSPGNNSGVGCHALQGLFQTRVRLFATP